MPRFVQALVILAAAISASLAGIAETPIRVALALDDLPRLDGVVRLSLEVSTIEPAPGTRVELLLPPGVDGGPGPWIVDLLPGRVFRRTVTLFVGRTGNLMLAARALHALDRNTVWGDMAAVGLYVGATPEASSWGWRVDRVPVVAPSAKTESPSGSRAETPWSPAPKHLLPRGDLPSTTALPSGTSTPTVPTAGSVQVVGRWWYTDRSDVPREVNQQLIEVIRADGSSLSPRAFCFTAADGTFACEATQPGGALRVRLRSWTRFETENGADRLGVFSGNEVPGGCGSAAIDCAYPADSPSFDCAAGTLCDVGDLVVDVSIGDPVLGAQQMTQDLVRSWKRFRFDPRRPAGSVSSGPARVNFPVPAGHGTHAHVGEGIYDDWISVEAPVHLVGDAIVHEYGHAVMSNLWNWFSPLWPIDDCPRLHYLSRPSGRGCALSEGFANFWAWYGNEDYDGDDDPTNDGPIFDFPGGARSSFETRDDGRYQTGDDVEGNVAASLGDLFDEANDGPATGPADRVHDGVANVWRTLAAASYDDFAGWWQGYWADAGNEPCAALDILQYNGIPYPAAGFQCPAGTALATGETYAGTVEGSSELDTWNFYWADLPQGLAGLVVDLLDLPPAPPADLDLYLRHGQPPTLEEWNCRSASSGMRSERCDVSTPAAGRWWVGVVNRDVGTIAYTLSARWSASGCDVGSCDDGNVCTDEHCASSIGPCTALANESPCDDGEDCTIGDHCSRGSCLGGTRTECVDANPCTDELCDATTGACLHVPNTAPCDDGDPCTLGDTCAASFCVAGAPKVCDDENPRTEDRCSPETGECGYRLRQGEPRQQPQPGRQSSRR